jgi:hypothetical protein
VDNTNYETALYTNICDEREKKPLKVSVSSSGSKHWNHEPKIIK